jgi:predicted  nucleic acid-binding Zn-ribbon protein
MKSKSHFRGMRDIPTIQGLTSRSTPATRELAAGEFARLEHEQARLERELNIWIENQKKTAKRLQHVQERLAHLRQTLLPVDTDDSKGAQRGRRSSPEESEGAGWREIKWEY